MIKNLLFAMAVLSLALAGGCAKGGNGIIPTVSVNSPSGVNPSALYPGQMNVMFTATTTSPANAPVTWSLTGTACTGAGNPCGTINSTTGVYQAPSAPVSATVTATLVSDSTIMGTLGIAVIPVTVVVTPVSVNVGQGLVQQFTAVAVPDAAPQDFTWSCTPTGACGSFGPNPNSVAVYTAPSSVGAVVVSATSTVPQPAPGVGQSNVKVVTSRLPSGTYAFRFSGYDGAGNSVAVAGSLTVGGNGTITSGLEDVIINGAYQQYTAVSGGYAPNPDGSNNLGTLTLDATATGGPKYIYTAVLTSSGILRMIESSSDGSGITGSGVMQESAANTIFNAGPQTFAFGFEGLDSSGNRVGYVGLLPMTPSGTGGTITGGLVDRNDNGTATSYSGVTGTYTTANGSWHMILTPVAGTNIGFDFFVSSGQTKTASNPLTLYAVCTDATYQALSGNMVYQFPMPSGYNNAAFSGTSVSNLRGVQVTNSAEVPDSSNVALIVGTTDGTSGGTGGAGGFTGTSDQNENGTIISILPTSPFSYTYVATNGNTGRYTFQMLGNTNPVVAPLPFVLYASGANRGFLLDQSSKAVMTGAMEPQPAKGFSYTPTELPGTYAAATIGNSDPSVTPVVENLLLTSTGNATYNVAGTQYTQSGSQPLMGNYTLNNNSAGGGTGTINLTTPAGQTYVIYAIDVTGTKNNVITDFMMMGTTSGTPSSIIFAQQ